MLYLYMAEFCRLFGHLVHLFQETNAGLANYKVKSLIELYSFTGIAKNLMN